jgi:hypothetical protein
MAEAVPEAPRTPLVTGLAVIAIHGADLARSRACHEGLLGLEARGSVPPGQLLRAGGATVSLEGGGRRRPAGAGLDRATASACFATTSVRAAWKALQSAGVPVVEPYRQLAPAFAMLRVADPDGTVVELAGEP